VKIYVDGALYGEGDARISVLDAGFRFSVGLRGRFICRGGKFFRLNRRLEWLKEAAAKIPMDFRWSIADVAEAMAATYDMNGFDGDGALLELILTAGNPAPNGDGDDGKNGGSMVIIAEKISDGDDGVKPLRLAALDGSKLSPAMIVEERQRISCGETAMAKALSGADGAIVLSPDGTVGACSEGELFAVSDGRVWAPEFSQKSAIWDIAAELLCEIQHPCATRQAKMRDISGAAECFVLDELFTLRPVGAIGNGSIGDGKIGAISAEIGEALAKKISGEFKEPF
jgi:branched-subunit amino acid aminotransferase/4-amino-4-deoxychorismate lyase